MAECKEATLADFPGIGRFTGLLGLDANRVPGTTSTFLGPISLLKKRWPELVHASATDLADSLASLRQPVDIMSDAAARMHTSSVKLVEEGSAIDEELARGSYRDSLLPALIAFMAHDFATAVQLFGQAFSEVSMSDGRVDPIYLAQYASSLVQSGDSRAREIAVLAEERLSGAPSSADTRARTTLAWFETAEVHARLGDANGAVRCLRRSLAAGPEFLRGWLVPPADADRFSTIQTDPVFVTFRRELAERPEATAVSLGGSGR